jgi:hypothetical protein
MFSQKQLIEQKGYTDSDLPSEETIRQKLQELGYCMRSVQKSQPKKHQFLSGHFREEVILVSLLKPLTMTFNLKIN